MGENLPRCDVLEAQIHECLVRTRRSAVVSIRMRVRDLVVILCAVAVVIALRPVVVGAPDLAASASPTPPSTAPSSQTPELVLEVVRRGPYLNDLIVTAKLRSPVPVGLYLREDIPVAYLSVDHQGQSWDLAPKVFARNGYPSHLDPTKLHDEIRQVRDFEWEFWGRDLNVPERDEVDRWLRGKVGFTVRLPYRDLQAGKGSRNTRSAIASLPEKY